MNKVDLTKEQKSIIENLNKKIAELIEHEEKEYESSFEKLTTFLKLANQYTEQVNKLVDISSAEQIKEFTGYIEPLSGMNEGLMRLDKVVKIKIKKT